jgi:transposase
LQPTRMDYRLILKSLEVNSMTAKLRSSWLVRQIIWIADKGYDSEKIRTLPRKQNIVPIIPMKSNSKRENKEFDRYLYPLSHLVENVFARLKHFRAIATRFDKLARNYQSMIYIACMLIWCKAKWGHALDIRPPYFLVFIL